MDFIRLSDSELIAAVRYKNPKDHHVSEARADYRAATSLTKLTMQDPRLGMCMELARRALEESLIDGPA